jgi:hypothetical protein
MTKTTNRIAGVVRNLTGHTADRMIYYSDIIPGDVETDLADTPFAPINLGVGATATAAESGPEDNNFFSYEGVGGVPSGGEYCVLHRRQ